MTPQIVTFPKIMTPFSPLEKCHYYEWAQSSIILRSFRRKYYDKRKKNGCVCRPTKSKPIFNGYQVWFLKLGISYRNLKDTIFGNRGIFGHFGPLGTQKSPISGDCSHLLAARKQIRGRLWHFWIFIHLYQGCFNKKRYYSLFWKRKQISNLTVLKPGLLKRYYMN